MLEEDYRNFRKSEFFDLEGKIKFILPTIMVAGLLIRFYYVPFNIPIILDGFMGYFLYALDISLLGYLPDYTLSQSGWGEFLSIFFMFFHSDQLIDYMNFQRTLSVIVSGITVFPIYLICRKFISRSYSLIGVIIFAFEPRIIINSTLGISDPLYIFAISLGILFFLNSNKKIIFLSFAFLAWATIIRPEGQFFFYAFSIIYFLRFRKNRRDIFRYVICLGIFLLVLSPIVIHRIECCEYDGIISRILAELWLYENNPTDLDENQNMKIYGPNFENGVKLLGWALFPIFIFLIPLGILKIVKERDFLKGFLIGVTIIVFFPIFYSISVAPDTRYVYPLFPIFCVISLFGIRWVSEKFNKKKLVLSFIVGCIIFSSIIFLEVKKIDHTEDIEAYQISKIIIDDIKGVNKGSTVSKFLTVAEIENRWPIDSYTGETRKSFEINRFSVNDVETLDDFIMNYREQGLTHLIIDSNSNSKFLLDIFEREESPYLEKIFDSHDIGYDYHVKVFEIDYSKIVPRK